PVGIYIVGCGYIVCGIVCLLVPVTYIAPTISFTNPWPMGIVFFFGETAGGTILMTYKTAKKEDNNDTKTG
ncbi:hypothetical protein ACFLS1_11900, partial [Verrucomicrobiota bacterium]